MQLYIVWQKDRGTLFRINLSTSSAVRRHTSAAATVAAAAVPTHSINNFFMPAMTAATNELALD